MLSADEYRVLNKTAASRRLAAGKVERAKFVRVPARAIRAAVASELECKEGPPEVRIGWLDK